MNQLSIYSDHDTSVLDPCACAKCADIMARDRYAHGRTDHFYATGHLAAVVADRQAPASTRLEAARDLTAPRFPWATRQSAIAAVAMLRDYGALPGDRRAS